MPTRAQVSYFGAGPAALPTPVLEAGAQAFVNYNDTGLSLAEISHRSSTAIQILADTKAALSSLLAIPDNYEVLFLHGGGSAEFSAVVYNIIPVWIEKRRKAAEKELGNDQKAVIQRVRKELQEDLRLDYVVTGTWSLKASQEAAGILGPLGRDFVNIVDARHDGKFGAIPPENEWKLSANDKGESAFVYFCDNETVDGVEFPEFPKVLKSSKDHSERIVVADMSSNFLSRRVDVNDYGVIFGGAQKNIGITGVTLVIIRKDLLTTSPPKPFLDDVGFPFTPTILNWSILAKNDSLYNTMPIHTIWIAGEVIRGLLAAHGDTKLAGQEAVSNAKAEVIYRILDANPTIYQPVNDRAVRSRMNICFRVQDLETEKRFLVGAEERLLQGLKGHRSVGGIRASNYNSVPMENIQKLAEYLTQFAQRK